MINFDYFDAIYCVNLKHRTDRWELSKKEFEKIGILDRVERFDAVANVDIPKRGFYESHLQVIKLAHERKLSNVLIFEDDVAFYKDMCEKKLNKSLEALKETDWEFYYLGGCERRIRHRPTYNRLTQEWSGEYDENIDYLWNCKSVGWTQSYAINSSVFEYLLERYNGDLWDEIVDNHKSLLDMWYQEAFLPKTYITIPTVTTQYDIASDLTKTRMSKKLRLNKKDNE
jgi:GR25 family glycosyltransferase involved in LPS biosynthesis